MSGYGLDEFLAGTRAAIARSEEPADCVGVNLPRSHVVFERCSTKKLPYVPFDVDYFMRGVRVLNPDLINFEVSALHGQGMDSIEFYTERKVVVERWI